MYTTIDQIDQNTIADHAHIVRHATEDHAAAAALDIAMDIYSHYDGVPVAVELQESDAWIKIHAAGETEESALDHAVRFGANRNDVIVRMPGTHPGGPYIWLSISETVYGPGLEEIE